MVARRTSIPVFMRVGQCTEREVGAIELEPTKAGLSVPSKALADLLRAAADSIESEEE